MLCVTRCGLRRECLRGFHGAAASSSPPRWARQGSRPVWVVVACHWRKAVRPIAAGAAGDRDGRPPFARASLACIRTTEGDNDCCRIARGETTGDCPPGNAGSVANAGGVIRRKRGGTAAERIRGGESCRGFDRIWSTLFEVVRRLLGDPFICRGVKSVGIAADEAEVARVNLQPPDQCSIQPGRIQPPWTGTSWIG